MSQFLKARFASISDNIVATLVVAGGALVISYLSAHSAYVQGLPLHWIIFWGLSAFALFAFAANFVSLILIRHARNRRESQDVWLHELAQRHREEIARYVLVMDCRAELNNSSATPYVKFTVEYYNSSVYTISIDPKFSGSISYGKRRLTEPIEISTHYPLGNLRHGYLSRLEFYQWLRQEELEFIMSNPQAGDARFDLSQLIFTIVGSKSDMGITPQPLRFGNMDKVNLSR